MTWEFREHTADLRVGFAAPSLEGMLSDAAGLVRQLVAGDSAPGRPEERRRVCIDADDPGELLFRFLRELLFLFESGRFVPAAVEVHRLDDGGMDATVAGERFDPARHETQPEVKAVTRHGLYVTRDASGWTAEVVFDL